jgi:hypothetical protein
VFYGENYAKLTVVENKYDPNGGFGWQTAVGGMMDGFVGRDIKCM